MEYNKIKKKFEDLSPLVSSRGPGGTSYYISTLPITRKQYLRIRLEYPSSTTQVERTDNGNIKTITRI